MNIDYSPIFLSFKLAFISTILLFFITIPIIYVLTKLKNWPKTIVETLINLPLVLPPTVVGFYILMCLSPNSVIGNFMSERLGIDILFSFTGLVIGSIIYSFPFMIQPVNKALESLPENIKYASYTLGKSHLYTFYKVLLPSVSGSILSAIMTSFAHTLGEFGIVMMIGGNIPDETRLASIAIYDAVENLDYHLAHTYALILIGVSFIILLSSNILLKKLY